MEGFLYVFEMPVGKYEFNDLYVEGNYLHTNWSSGGDYSFPFEDFSGRTIYAGNIHIDAKNIGNSDYSLETISSRKNNYSRDVELFKKKIS